MVGLKKLVWLPVSVPESKKEGNNLGILAFETAKTMSRLISLYKSISDEKISRLRNDVVRSKGVEFLNSGYERYLMSLAGAEHLEDLDRATAAVARLGKKCSDFGLERFDIVYKELISRDGKSLQILRKRIDSGGGGGNQRWLLLRGGGGGDEMRDRFGHK